MLHSASNQLARHYEGGKFTHAIYAGWRPFAGMAEDCETTGDATLYDLSQAVSMKLSSAEAPDWTTINKICNAVSIVERYAHNTNLFESGLYTSCTYAKAKKAVAENAAAKPSKVTHTINLPRLVKFVASEENLSRPVATWSHRQLRDVTAMGLWLLAGPRPDDLHNCLHDRYVQFVDADDAVCDLKDAVLLSVRFKNGKGQKGAGLVKAGRAPECQAPDKIHVAKPGLSVRLDFPVEQLPRGKVPPFFEAIAEHKRRHAELLTGEDQQFLFNVALKKWGKQLAGGTLAKVMQDWIDRSGAVLSPQRFTPSYIRHSVYTLDHHHPVHRLDQCYSAKHAKETFKSTYLLNVHPDVLPYLKTEGSDKWSVTQLHFCSEA